jgi:hypothetical protein
MARSPVHRTRRRILWGLAVVATLLVLDLAWATWTTASGLTSAREDLQAGTDLLRAGDPQGAGVAFQDAENAAGGAAAAMGHPAMLAVRALPWVGDDAGAVAAMARAAEATATGGGALVDAVIRAGWTGEGVPALGAGGTVDLEAVAAAAPPLRTAADELTRANDDLATVDADGLTEAVATRLVTAREAVDEAAGVVSTASDLADLLPGMLGADGSRRYLVAFQNLDAPRGTGGFLGFYGVLEAEGGDVSLTALAPASTVPDVPPVDALAEVKRRYATFGMLTTLYAANYSPDVPTSARNVLAIAEAGGLGSFDGVIFTDTKWMEAMLAAVGPVETGAWPEPISADNVIDVMNRDVFLIDDAAESDRVQAQIGSDVWNAVLERTPPAQAFVEAWGAAVRAGHFAVYLDDPGEQELVTSLGAARAFEPGGNPLTVVWQDLASSRAGFFAEKPVAMDVILAADGSAEVTTTVTLDNRAPADGPDSVLLGGPGFGPDRKGWWFADANVYLPAGAEGVKVSTEPLSFTEVTTEFERPVAAGTLYAGPGKQMTMTVRYRVPEAATLSEGVWTYRVDVLPQPSLRPAATTVTVRVPDGTELLASPGFKNEGAVATYEGAPTDPTALVVRYR